MITTITEYRLYDDDNCITREEGDSCRIETDGVIFKDVSIITIREDEIEVEDDDGNEYTILIDNIISIDWYNEMKDLLHF